MSRRGQLALFLLLSLCAASARQHQSLAHLLKQLQTQTETLPDDPEFFRVLMNRGECPSLRMPQWTDAPMLLLHQLSAQSIEFSRQRAGDIATVKTAADWRVRWLCCVVFAPDAFSAGTTSQNAADSQTSSGWRRDST